MYQVKFYKGDYLQRQLAANADKAVAYVEHHFNSSASASANYAVVVVGSSIGAAAPAVLLEPLFASHPQQAEAIRSEAGQAALARILAESIRRFFPDGGLIAFSVGHKYKTSSPNDRGVALAGGGTEADHAEKVLQKAAQLLADEPAAPTQRMLRVMRGERLLFEVAVDEDAVLSWSSERNLLFIPE